VGGRTSFIYPFSGLILIYFTGKKGDKVEDSAEAEAMDADNGVATQE
jgi:hypothetical protein